MKQHFVLLLLVAYVFVQSCTSIEEEVTQTYVDGKPKEVMLYEVSGNERLKVGIKKFYPDGTLELVGNYSKAGNQEGKWEYFYKDGTLWTRTFFTEGKRNGEVTNFYENGKLRYSGQYKGDEKVGLWKFYTKNGELAQEKSFD